MIHIPIIYKSSQFLNTFPNNFHDFPPDPDGGLLEVFYDTKLDIIPPADPTTYFPNKSLLLLFYTCLVEISRGGRKHTG